MNLETFFKLFEITCIIALPVSCFCFGLPLCVIGFIKLIFLLADNDIILLFPDPFPFLPGEWKNSGNYMPGE